MKRFIFYILLALAVSPAIAQTTFTSVVTGDWDDGATWGMTSPGVQGTDWPAATDHAVIIDGTTVNLTGNETIANLTINSGGVLFDAASVITVNGNLDLSGTYTGSKDLQFTGGAGTSISGTGVYNSSGSFDVNNSTSINSGSYLTFILDIVMANGVVVTNNGIVIISRDLKGASGAWTNAANSKLKLAKNIQGTLTASATGNTVVYNQSGAQNIVDPASSTYYNLTIEGTGTKTLSANTIVSGDVVITSGTFSTNAANYSLNIGGDLTNAGTLDENSSTTTFDGTGTHTVTNSLGETFYDLVINKSGTLTLANDVSVTNSLTFTTGIVDAGSNILTLGTSTANEGTLTHTAGQVVGKLERWIGSTGFKLFPVGSSSFEATADISFNTAVSSYGSVIFEFIASSPGALTSPPINDGGIDFYNTFVDGYWDLSTANGFDLGANTYALALDGSGFSAFTIDANTHYFTRADSGSDWTNDGTHVGTVGTLVDRTSMTLSTAQFAFVDDTNCAAPTTSSIAGSSEVCTSDQDESYFVTDTPSSTYTWTITGGTQDTGGTTNSITVDWGATGQVGTVQVVEYNGCTNGAPVELSVNINSIAPTSISGSISIAESTQDVPYSISAISGYTYTWTITGGTLDADDGVGNITVDWGTAGTGNVSVVALKAGCTAAPAFDIDVIKYIVINSAQTGAWSSSSTWDVGVVPTSTDNARILNTHNVTIGSNEVINHFIIDAGGTLTSSNKTLTVDGDFTVNGTYSGGSQPLIINGANATIDGTGTISVNSGKDIDFKTGNKTIASTAVLTIATGDIDIAASITLTNNGTIIITDNITGANASTTIWTNADNSILGVGGSLLTTGTLNASASNNRVAYTGAAQTIKVPSSSTYFNLRAGGSGANTLAGSIQIDGDFTLLGTATLAPGTNSVTFGGTTPELILDQSGNGIDFYDLIFDNATSAFTVSVGHINVSNSLTMTNGVLTIIPVVSSLTLGSVATTNDGNAGSYIDGKIIKTFGAAGSITFPTGDGVVWAPIGALNVSAASTFEAQYHFAAYSDLTTDLSFTNLSDIEYWQLDQTAGTATTDVRLYYKDQGRSGIVDVVSSDLQVARYTGALWTALGFYAGTNIGNQTAEYVDVTTVNTFSPFTLASQFGINPVPVELVYFRGNMLPKGVVLEWQTASELNNDFFEVEVSSDGENYMIIAKIDGQGTSTAINNYEYIDRYPATGLNYYRLKQTDFNGDFEYSKIISVMNESPPRLSFSAYPQPAVSNLTLQIMAIDDTSEMNLTIYNLGGIVIKNFSLDPMTKQLPVDISEFTNGLYLVRLAQANQFYHGKIIIQK